MEQSEIVKKQYMVEFDVPELTPYLINMIPDQRAAIDELMVKGKMVSYSLSMKRDKVWSLMLASHEAELLQLIDELPMSSYMSYNYKELMFHNTVHLIPAMSLNWFIGGEAGPPCRFILISRKGAKNAKESIVQIFKAYNWILLSLKFMVFSNLLLAWSDRRSST